MKLNTFLLIVAVLYALFGLGMVFAPAQTFSAQGLTLNESGQLLARTTGAAIIGLAVMLWIARSAENAAAVRAILLGNLVYIVIEIVVLVLGLLSGVLGPAGWGGVVFDGLFAAGFAYYYFKG